MNWMIERTLSDADLDQIAYEMTVLAEQAGSVLTPDARPPRAAGAWA